MIVHIASFLYTVDGISVNIHNLISVAGWIISGEQDLSPKQHILKYCYTTLNNTAWLQIMKKIIDGLHHLHGLGIVH